MKKGRANKMKIVLSFDDGRIDFANTALILKKHNLHGSFHITTGFIDGTFNTDAFGKNRKPLTVEQIIEMYQNGMEISSHGDKHVMETSDYQTSIAKLKQWGVAQGESVGFSIPNSKYSDEELQNFNNENLPLYIRAGRSPKCYTLKSKINYLLYKLFKTQKSYNRFNIHNMNSGINSFPLYSIVIAKHIRAKNVISFIESFKNQNVVLVLMFHSVVERPTNKWEYAICDFEKICTYLEEQKSSNNFEVDSFSYFVKQECHKPIKESK